MLAPVFNDDFRHIERIEDFAVEQFVTEFPVEAFAIAVFTECPACDQLRECLGDEIRAVVGTNVRRDAPQDEEVGKARR